MINDLISRAAAMAEIEEYIEEYSDLDENGYHSLKWCAMEEARDVLSMLPAVDAAPVVHAEWIEEPDREGHYHCSACGVVWGMSAMAMKHCPNCTAKMTNSPLWDMEDEAATEMTQYCERYGPTYNPEDGSM